jgi:hypothetical protein
MHYNQYIWDNKYINHNKKKPNNSNYNTLNYSSINYNTSSLLENRYINSQINNNSFEIISDINPINNKMVCNIDNKNIQSKFSKNNFIPKKNKFNTQLNTNDKMGNIQFSEEIEYMNMKLDLKLLEHKLSRLTSMIIPIDNIQRNKHELSILNHIKENNNKLVMKFVNIKNNENKIINEVQDNLIKNELYFVTESNSFQIPNLTLSNIKSSESKKNNSPKNEIKMKEREEKKMR